MPDNRAEAIGRLTDMVGGLDPHRQPFLYYLPKLLITQEFKNINAENAVTFAEFALKHDSLPIVKDALLILNRIVEPEEGKLQLFAKDIFYGNNSFFWNELGNHTSAPDVVRHIFHKTVFFLSVGK